MGYDFLMGPFHFPKARHANIYIFYKFIWNSIQTHAIAIFPLLYIIMKYIVMIIEINEYKNIFMV